jgi:hypothetical protein
MLKVRLRDQSKTLAIAQASLHMHHLNNGQVEKMSETVHGWRVLHCTNT